jgi:hypothetical protein
MTENEYRELVDFLGRRFEVSPFSNFAFSHDKLNSAVEPVSTVFSGGLACAGIASFKRTRTHVTKA